MTSMQRCAVEFDDVRQGLRPGAGAARRELLARARPRLRPARRERRGQVHADEDPRGLRAARPAASSGSTASRSSFASSREAEALGIVLIHQEFNLAEDLSVAQNIFLGHEKKKRLAARRRGDGARGRRRAARRSAWTSTRAPRCADLIVAEKQLVEIAKALARHARLLIMDEPTATLTPGETERLFALIAQLRGRRRDHRLHLAQARRGRARHRRGDRDARRPLRHPRAHRRRSRATRWPT